MNKGNLFVQVTNTGSVWDKTFGANRRIPWDSKYTLGNNIITFRPKGKLTQVDSINESGDVVYTHDLTEQGMYLIAASFIQKLPTTVKEVRVLYNRLSHQIGKPQFKIVPTDSLEVPFSIKIHAFTQKGVFVYKFVIKVNERVLNNSHINEIFELIKQTSKLNLKSIMDHYQTFQENHGAILEINDDFIKLAKEIEIIEERKRQRHPII